MLRVVSRALFALLLAMLVIVESAGVARAIGFRTMVSCCCGRHHVARPCHCLRCPSKLRAQPPAEHGAEAAVHPLSACVPHGEDGVLTVLATEAELPVLAAPVDVSILTGLPLLALCSIDTAPSRPPP